MYDGATDNGGLDIDFDNAFHHFTYTGRSFDFFVNDVSLTAGNSVPVTAGIRNIVSDRDIPPVPEPETYALLLAGLGAVAFMVRRRRS